MLNDVRVPQEGDRAANNLCFRRHQRNFAGISFIPIEDNDLVANSKLTV